MKMINVIYFGSPQFSAQILESLLRGTIPNLRVVGVVTNKDKPVGRKRILTPSPVAQLTEKYHLPTFKPDKLDESNLMHLKLLKPDLFVIAAYGKIIPQAWLDLPTIAPLNLHFSLLPKYRGALCIGEAIKNEDQQTGVTLMEVDKEMDHGPIIAQIKQAIGINDNLATLTEKLTKKAITLLTESLPIYLSGKIKSKPQDHNKASYTPSHRDLTRESAYIPWETLKAAITGHNQTSIHALIRSLNPDPGAWTKINGLEVKVITTSLDPKTQSLIIETIQTPGKKTVSFKQFLQGHPKIKVI